MRRTLVVLALVSALAPACKDKDNTKIVVAVWSDLAVPAELDTIRIEVTGPTGTGSKTFVLTAGSEAGKTRLPATLDLVPLGAKDATFTVKATGLHVQTELVAQTARISFVAGQTLLLKLFLARDCQVVTCPADHTCAAGACNQPIAISNLPPYDPGQLLSPPDAGAVLDSGGGGSGGAGGTSNLDDARGTGGAAGNDARPTDGFVPDTIDAPLGGAGGMVASGGVVGTGGIASAGGVSTGGTAGATVGMSGAGGTVASGGVVGTGGITGAGGASTGGTGGRSGGVGGTVASGGVVGTGGITGAGGASTGGTTVACQGSATQCSGNGVQTCTGGQWGGVVACGVRQTCIGPVGTAKCTCNVDPVCSSVGGTCANASTLTTCSQDAQACFYQSSATTCTNGACSGAAGTASCCANACTAGATCLSGTSLQTCAVAANGCTANTTSTCTNGACSGAAGAASCCTNACTVGATCLSGTSLQTCAVATNGCTAASTTTCMCSGASGAAMCVSSTWAEWPMPNCQSDVTAGAPNLASYIDNGDGTVTDNITKLMWQQAVLPATTMYTWAEAKAFCPTLILAGHNDWRLPSIIELASIVDLGQSYPSINGTYFSTTPQYVFWSSSPLAGSSSNAWLVGFYDGTLYNYDASNPSNVRCVR
jgi:hypothetical protein